MISIRRYVETDLDVIVTLWYRTWTNTFPHLHHPQPFEQWKIRFQQDLAQRGSVWVAAAEEQIVGFIVVMESENILDQIFVNPDVQRIGIGTVLLNWAKTICPKGLSLSTLQENYSARKFYEKHGFIAGCLSVNPINGQPNIKYTWNPESCMDKEVTGHNKTSDDD